jgi:hypothetical protein
VSGYHRRFNNSHVRHVLTLNAASRLPGSPLSSLSLARARLLMLPPVSLSMVSFVVVANREVDHG